MHVPKFDTLSLRLLDPNVAIAFYFRTREEFDDFCNQTRIANQAKREADTPFLYNVEASAPVLHYAGNDKADICDEDDAGCDRGNSGGGGSGLNIEEEYEFV